MRYTSNIAHACHFQLFKLAVSHWSWNFFNKTWYLSNFIPSNDGIWKNSNANKKKRPNWNPVKFIWTKNNIRKFLFFCRINRWLSMCVLCNHQIRSNWQSYISIGYNVLGFFRCYLLSSIFHLINSFTLHPMNIQSHFCLKFLLTN